MDTSKELTPGESENSLIDSTPITSQIIEPVETLPAYKRKPYEFTEQRKENLRRANQTRKEKGELRKILKCKYDEAASELQKTYKAQLIELLDLRKDIVKPPTISTLPTMSAATASSIPIVPVTATNSTRKTVKNKRESSSEDEEPTPVKAKKGKKVVESDDSSSSEEEKVLKKKKSVKKSKKKVVYIEDSDESSESPSPVHVKKVSHRTKKTHFKDYASDSDSDSSGDEYMQRREYQKQMRNMKSMGPPRRDHYDAPPHPAHFIQNSQVGTHSGCRF